MSPSTSSAPPARWLRTLPWLAGLLLGTTAHIVWWTGQRPAPPPAVQRIEVNLPPVTTQPAQAPAPAAQPACDLAQRPRSSHRARSSHRPRSLPQARGAVVCTERGCTIRRSFVRSLLADPRMISRGPWRLTPTEDGGAELLVHGVYPGSVGDLLGLRNGDAIVAFDGQPLKSWMDHPRWTPPSRGPHEVTLTVRRHDRTMQMRYRVVDR